MRLLLVVSFLLAGCVTPEQSRFQSPENRLAVLANGVVLPSSLVVKVPAPAIGNDAKAFSGRWEGSSIISVSCALIVENVKSNTEATVVFAMATTGKERWKGAWQRKDAVIDGTTMRVKAADNSDVLFQLNPDGTISAKLPLGTGVFTVLLRKVSVLTSSQTGQPSAASQVQRES